VVPDLLHVVPVGDDTVFDGVLQGQDTSLGLSFISMGRGDETGPLTTPEIARTQRKSPSDPCRP
jgi:hypothetical protein